MIIKVKFVYIFKTIASKSKMKPHFTSWYFSWYQDILSDLEKEIPTLGTQERFFIF